MCVFEYLLNSKTFSREVKLSVAVVMLGVGVCTVTDFGVNLGGFVAALVAVICTSLQQIVRLLALKRLLKRLEDLNVVCQSCDLVKGTVAASGASIQGRSALIISFLYTA